MKYILNFLKVNLSCITKSGNISGKINLLCYYMFTLILNVFEWNY